MATDKQIRANRENARRSTGPRTAEGKARSARNRTSHGMTSKQVVLPTESSPDYDALHASLSEEWGPQTETECQQVDLIAQHWWRLLRLARMENDAFTRPVEKGYGLQITTSLEGISRYEGRVRRAYQQAIDLLRKLQAARRLEESKRTQFAAQADETANETADVPPSEQTLPAPSPPSSEIHFEGDLEDPHRVT